MPFLKKPPFNQGTIRIPLGPVIGDHGKKRKATDDLLDKVLSPKLEIEVREMNKINTYIAFNPNRNILEDRAKKDDYSRKDMALVMSRTLLTRQLIEEIF